jgi:hypothetical protein
LIIYYYADQLHGNMKRLRQSNVVGVSVLGIDVAEDSETSSSPFSSARYEWKNSASSAISPTSNRSNKRPRTEEYLRAIKKLDTQRQSIQFFQQQLESIRKDGSASTSLSDILLQNLQVKWECQQHQFQAFHQGMVDIAQRRIQLKNGIESMYRHLQQLRGPNSKCNHSTNCPLERLQQGEETTSALFGLITDYAGFPSEGEIDDCQRLMTVVLKMNQA